MQLSIESKNKAVAFSLFCETTSNLSSRVRELRKEKRKLVDEFAEEHCDGDKNKVKTRLRVQRSSLTRWPRQKKRRKPLKSNRAHT